MKKIFLILMILTPALVALCPAAPTAAAWLDYDRGTFSSIISTALSAGTWDERVPAGYPAVNTSYTQQNATAYARSSAAAIITTRPAGLTAQVYVSAATANDLNDIAPSSYPRASASVTTSDFAVPGIWYTVTATSLQDHLANLLVKYHFASEANTAFSSGFNSPSDFTGAFLNITDPDATLKYQVEFNPQGAGPHSLLGYAPAAVGDRLWFFLTCGVSSSVPPSGYANETIAQFSLDLDILRYVKISAPPPSLIPLVDTKLYTPVEWQPGWYGFQHLASGDIFTPIQLQTGEFLFLNNRTGAVTFIPLPPSVWLLGSGLLGLAGWRLMKS
ncbi:MAG: hypothetical protein P8168_12455 [Deltaproteobacteria bacterium]|jgi:hypothetical protein